MKSISVGYKQTEVGVIPTDWKLDFLGQKASIFRGGSPRPIESYITTSSEGVNWIKIGDVSANAKYIKSTSEKIIASGVKHSREVKAGDLLLSNSMSYGRPYILCIDGCIHDGWLTISNYEHEFEKEFLCYILGSECVSKQYSELAAGTGVKNLNKQIVGKVQVPYPASIDEQNAIATALSDMDALIEAKTALLEKKRAIKQGVMQELLTGRRRLPGFPVTPMKKTDIGEIPEDWEVCELGACCKLYQPKTLSQESLKDFGEFPVYGANGVIGYHDQYNHEFSEIIITCRGNTCGVVNFSLPFSWINGNAMVTHVQSWSKVSQRYLLHHLKFSSKIGEAITGGAQPQITREPLGHVKISYPVDKTEQESIVVVLSDMDKDIDSLVTEISKLRNLKQGMMQELLTGRIRLVK